MNQRDALWNLRFHELEEFQLAHGHCDVPRKCDGLSHELGRWVGKQRQTKRFNELNEEREAKKRTKLSLAREAKLDSIGFVWNVRKFNSKRFLGHVDWNVRFKELLHYRIAAGDCNVPQRYILNPHLGRWVQTQRRANKNNMLTKEHVETLNTIGFDWGRHRTSGRKNTCNQQLEEHKRTHHEVCDVPEGCSGNTPPHLHKLATEHGFINRQTEVLAKEGGVELGTTDTIHWDVHFRELLSYLQTHGDCNVPQCDPCNPLLAIWVSEQRNDYDLTRRGEQTPLTPLREAKLDALGFTWFVGGSTKEDAYAEGVSSSAVWPEESQSENKVRSEHAGVATSPDNITSG